MNKKTLLTYLGLLGLVLASSASASQQRNREVQNIMNNEIDQCVKNAQFNANEKKINVSHEQLKTLCVCTTNLKTEAAKKFISASENSVKDIESGKTTVKEASAANVEQMHKFMEKGALECVKKAGLPTEKETKTTSKQKQTQQPNTKQQTGSEIGQKIKQKTNNTEQKTGSEIKQTIKQKIKQNTDENIAQTDKKTTPNFMSPGLR